MICEEHFFVNAVNKQLDLSDLHYNYGDELVGRGKTKDNIRNDEKNEQEIITNAVKKVRSEWQNLVKQAYSDNASEIMLHSLKGEKR